MGRSRPSDFFQFLQADQQTLTPLQYSIITLTVFGITENYLVLLHCTLRSIIKVNGEKIMVEQSKPAMII